jgi:hypothetical protein
VEDFVDLDRDVLAQLVLGGVDQFLVAHDRHRDVPDEHEAAADGADDALGLEVLLGEQLVDGVGDGDLGGDLGDPELGDLVLTGGLGQLDRLDEFRTDVQADQVTLGHEGSSFS